MNLTNIPLESIDPSDSTYKITPGAEGTLQPDTRETIATFGVLRPPILQESANGWIIVLGRRTVCHLKGISPQGECPCFTVAASTPPNVVWSLIIRARGKENPLSVMEQALFFQAVHELPAEDIREFAAIMGLGGGPYKIQRLLKLTELPASLQEALHQGHLDHKTAEELTSLEAAESQKLFSIISALHLSVANQRKFVHKLLELGKRCSSELNTIVEELAIYEIIASKQTPAQKAQSLMGALDRRLSPQLSAAEEEFAKFRDALKLPENCTLSHSPAFEKDTLELGITFANREEFRRFWDDFQKEGRGNGKGDAQ